MTDEPFFIPIPAQIRNRPIVCFVCVCFSYGLIGLLERVRVLFWRRKPPYILVRVNYLLATAPASVSLSSNSICCPDISQAILESSNSGQCFMVIMVIALADVSLIMLW